MLPSSSVEGPTSQTAATSPPLISWPVPRSRVGSTSTSAASSKSSSAATAASWAVVAVARAAALAAGDW
eukprot:3969515-Prymnesium_polylepis.1